jgi:osmoprotectant transport system permease protein
MGHRAAEYLTGLLLVAAAAVAVAAEEGPLRIGSKRFTESYILGEIAVQSAQRAGASATHTPGLGNTAILQQALVNGTIDAYPEYTGTIAREILRVTQDLDLASLNARLKPLGLAAGVPLGFSNSYAIGVNGAIAGKLGIKRISELASHPQLRFGFSHEFLGRQDGWPGLQAAYGLKAQPRGLDHGLAYEALAKGEIDVIDLYSTDAKIARYAIRVLEDDRDYFPRYEAVFLYREEAAVLHPRAWSAIRALEGRIDGAQMIRLNARAELDRRDFATVAAEFLGSAATGAPRTLLEAIFAPDFPRLLGQHVALVFGSLALALAFGIPLGVAAARVRWLAQPVLLAAGLVQTIPSLAMLAFLIPLTGTIGAWPATIALFLYALLPIVRNTHAGILGVRREMRQAALALGLATRDILFHVELPLARPMILAGVKTAAVISVGTATIAAFIGAGGFGERIAQGLALNDHVALLAGALPAAALALAVHGLFEALERLAGGSREIMTG